MKQDKCEPVDGLLERGILDEDPLRDCPLMDGEQRDDNSLRAVRRA